MNIQTISKAGGSRIMAVTKVIPKDWRIIEVIDSKLNNDTVTLKIRKIQ